MGYRGHTNENNVLRITESGVEEVGRDEALQIDNDNEMMLNLLFSYLVNIFLPLKEWDSWTHMSIWRYLKGMVVLKSYIGVSNDKKQWNGYTFATL